MEIRELAHEEWPAQLLEIPQPPKQLWVQGKLPVVGTKLLTVVGSRAMTRYGQEACEKLISDLAGYPISIVSGLALTLITARLASEYNRELLCSPPHRRHKRLRPHLFIRLGATLVSEPIHILETLQIPPREAGATTAPSDLVDTELVIWNMLEEPKTRDEILRSAAGEVLTSLIALELRGLIREEFGAWHRT